MFALIMPRAFPSALEILVWAALHQALVRAEAPGLAPEGLGPFTLLIPSHRFLRLTSGILSNILRDCCRISLVSLKMG